MGYESARSKANQKAKSKSAAGAFCRAPPHALAALHNR